MGEQLEIENQLRGNGKYLSGSDQLYDRLDGERESLHIETSGIDQFTCQSQFEVGENGNVERGSRFHLP